MRARGSKASSLVRPPKLQLLVEPPLERLLPLPRAASHARQHLVPPNPWICAQGRAHRMAKVSMLLLVPMCIQECCATTNSTSLAPP